MNPGYPSNPASYLCKATLYEIQQKQFDYYALQYIGYISVPESGDYIFRVACNELCQINMTKSGSNRVLGHYNDVWKDNESVTSYFHYIQLSYSEIFFCRFNSILIKLLLEKVSTIICRKFLCGV